MEHKWNMAVTAKKIDSLVNTLSKAHCEYLIVSGAYLDTLEYPSLACDNHGEPIRVGDAYMVITCANGYKYYINVTADSPYTACAEVFKFIQHRL